MSVKLNSMVCNIIYLWYKVWFSKGATHADYRHGPLNDLKRARISTCVCMCSIQEFYFFCASLWRHNLGCQRGHYHICNKKLKGMDWGDISDGAETVVIKTRHQRFGWEGGLKGGGQRIRKVSSTQSERCVLCRDTSRESLCREKNWGEFPVQGEGKSHTHTHTHTHAYMHVHECYFFTSFTFVLVFPHQRHSNMSYYSVWISVRLMVDTIIWCI